jgi:hypothetical protein
MKRRKQAGVGLRKMTDSQIVRALKNANRLKATERAPSPPLPNAASRPEEKLPVPAKPSESEKQLIAELQSKVGQSGDGVGFRQALSMRATGVGNSLLGTRLLTDLVNLPRLTRCGSPSEELFTMSALLLEMKPRDAAETLLLVQAIGAHDAALRFLTRGSQDGESAPVIEACIRSASSLMRLFLQQIEQLRRMQGKAVQQKVVVEHVNVSPGGQAVVGVVETPRITDGGGGHSEN